jgi:phenylacetic acid degradation operon negative regulatory protein
VSQERNILRPLSARSIVASTLLGCHPSELPTRALVEMGALYGIPEGTLRVALSRMLSSGELEAIEGGYRLTGTLLNRQARQEEGWRPTLREWDGAWVMAVVVAARRSAVARAELRAAMVALRLSELREGVWLRPDNLDPARLPSARTVAAAQCRWFAARPPSDARLVSELWNLASWARRAEKLRREMDRLVDRVEAGDHAALGPTGLVSAAVLQHFVHDPLLPPQLLPAAWPGEALRAEYARFDTALRRLFAAWARDQRRPAVAAVRRRR